MKIFKTYLLGMTIVVALCAIFIWLALSAHAQFPPPFKIIQGGTSTSTLQYGGVWFSTSSKAAPIASTTITINTLFATTSIGIGTTTFTGNSLGVQGGGIFSGNLIGANITATGSVIANNGGFFASGTSMFSNFTGENATTTNSTSTSLSSTVISVTVTDVGNGINLIGNTVGVLSPSIRFWDSLNQRGSLSLAEATGHFSTQAIAGDIVLRAFTGNLLLQSGQGASSILINTSNVAALNGGFTSTASSTLLNVTNYSGTNATTTNLYVTGVASLNGASTTITNLVAVNASSTNATSTTLYVSGSLSVNGASSTILQLVTVNSTSTNATTTALGVSGPTRFRGQSYTWPLTQPNIGTTLCLEDDGTGNLAWGNCVPVFSTGDFKGNGFSLIGWSTLTATSGIFASGTAEFDGVLNATGGIVSTASSTLLNIQNISVASVVAPLGVTNTSVFTLATSTNATSTSLYVSGSLGVNGASSTITNLNATALTVRNSAATSTWDLRGLQAVDIGARRIFATSSAPNQGLNIVTLNANVKITSSPILITVGTGGDGQTQGFVGGNSGNLTVSIGNAGIGGTEAAGGNAGTLLIQGGAGGAGGDEAGVGSPGGVGGTGSPIQITAGAGGAGGLGLGLSGPGSGNTGGGITATLGNGGAGGDDPSTGGNGGLAGTFTLQGGAGGKGGTAGTDGIGGDGSSFNFTTGTGGVSANVAPGNGGNFTVQLGSGGLSGSASNGTDGSFLIRTGLRGNATQIFAIQSGGSGNTNLIAISTSTTPTVNSIVIAITGSATTTIPNTVVNAYSFSTSTSIFPLMRLDTTGKGSVLIGRHLEFASTTGESPIVSSCGTAPNFTSNSDMAGKVTIGTGVISSCTIAFGQAWNVAPACFANDETNILLVRAASTITTLTLTVATTFNGDVVSYACFGRRN